MCQLQLPAVARHKLYLDLAWHHPNEGSAF